MIEEMTEEMAAKKIEELFESKHRLIYEEVEFFIDVMLGLVSGHDDWLRVVGRPNLCRILLNQSEAGDKELRQVITWEYDHRQDLVDGLINKQSFVAKALPETWTRQVYYFSSIGSNKISGGMMTAYINLPHREMQKVMKDVWNVYLVNRARAEK